MTSDTSSPSQLFGFLNGANTQPQSAYSQPAIAPGTGGSIFDRISKPTPSSDGHQDQLMPAGSSVTPQSSRPFGFLNGANIQPQSTLMQPATALGTGGSLFDRVSKPISNSSAQDDQPMASNPPISSQSSPPFSFLNQSSAQAQMQGGNKLGTGSSLFEGISKPTPDSSTQDDQPMASNPPNSSQSSRPFSFLNQSSAQAQRSQKQDAGTPGTGSSLFERITKPTTESNTQPTSVSDAATAHKIPQTTNPPNNLFALSGSAQPAAKKLFGQTLFPQAANQSTSTESPNDAGKKLFGQTLFPQANQSSSTDTANDAGKKLFGQTSFLQAASHSSSKESSNEAGKKLFGQSHLPQVNQTSSTETPNDADKGAKAGSKRKYDNPPDGCEDFTEEERNQLTTGYRLRDLDAYVHKRLRTNPPKSELILLKGFYHERTSAILRAEGGPVKRPEVKLKRKVSDEHSDEHAEHKRVRTQSPPQAPQETVSHELGWTSSQTSSLFKGILGNKGQEKGPQPSTNHDGIDSASNSVKTPDPKAPKFDTGEDTLGNKGQEKGSRSSANHSAAMPSSSPAKVPTFGTGTTPNFLAQFSKAAGKTAEEVKNKRKAEEYDSDEEDEASWERKYEEEQRLKRQKHEEAGKSNNNKFINGKLEWVSTPKDDSPSVAAPQEKSKGPATSIFDQPHVPTPNEHNIFGHLANSASRAKDSDTGNGNKKRKSRDDDAEEDEEDDEDYDEDDEDNEADGHDSDSADEGGYVEPKLPSLFDRISRDDKGKPIREIPKSDTKPVSRLSSLSRQGNSFESQPLFTTNKSLARPEGGDSSSTDDKPSSTLKTPIFGQTSASALSGNVTAESSAGPVKTGKSPVGDNTWKADTPIKFGAQSNPPTVDVTGPSPSKSPFTGLFGASKNNATADSPAKPTTSLPITTPPKTATAPLGFGFTPANRATNSLAAPLNIASAGTSRATSPGITTGESANESNAEKDDDHAPSEAQLDLVSGGPGEEYEDAIFNVKAKAHVFDPETKQWVIKGLGTLRVMKNRDTGLVRILMRQSPSGKIVINTPLLKDFKYENTQEKIIRIPIVDEDAKVTSWLLKVGDAKDAAALTSVLLENRPT